MRCAQRPSSVRRALPTKPPRLQPSWPAGNSLHTSEFFFTPQRCADVSRANVRHFRVSSRGTSLAQYHDSFVLLAPCERTHNLPTHLPLHREAVERRPPTCLYRARVVSPGYMHKVSTVVNILRLT